MAQWRLLRQVTHPTGQHLSLDQVDYHQLTAALPPVLELSGSGPGLWRRFVSQDPEEPGGATLYRDLERAVSTAAVIAPTRADKEKWVREWMALVLRMLRDPNTRRVYAEKRPPVGDHSDFIYVSTIRARDLQGPRFWLAQEGFIGPEDWGFYHGFYWNNDPGAVLRRDGVVMVDAEVLRAAGVPIQVGTASVVASIGSRRATIPLTSPRQGDGRRGFRQTSGKVYVPIEEFHRQGVLEVQVQLRSQMVELGLEPPHDEQRPAPARASSVQAAAPRVDLARGARTESGTDRCHRVKSPKIASRRGNTRGWYPALVGLCTGLVVAAASSAASTDPAAEAVLRELQECTHPGGHPLPHDRIDYGRLAAAIPPAVELSRSAPGLWRKVLVHKRLVPRDMILYDALLAALTVAVEIAPNAQDQERWLRIESEVTLRMLRDKETVRIYNDSSLDRGDASDWVYVRIRQFRDLQANRARLIRNGLLAANDWGFYQGLTWINDPGAVILREGIAFVEFGALQRGGVPVQANAIALWAVYERRRAQIPIASGLRANARRAFRDANGRLFVPVEEFHAQGLFHVQVNSRSQMVELWLTAPRDE